MRDEYWVSQEHSPKLLSIPNPNVSAVGHSDHLTFFLEKLNKLIFLISKEGDKPENTRLFVGDGGEDSNCASVQIRVAVQKKKPTIFIKCAAVVRADVHAHLDISCLWMTLVGPTQTPHPRHTLSAL